MTEHTNTPELRFPEFKDEWIMAKLSDISQYINGGIYEPYVVSKGKYELITLKSVTEEGTLIKSNKYLNINTNTIPKNSLIMILSEQAPGLIGKTATIRKSDTYVLNQRVANIIPNDGINFVFLSKSINTKQKEFSKLSAGTKVKNISKKQIENFNIYMPDYYEQKKIGDLFDKLDQQIELEEKKLELLEQQKRGYMQKIFSQELRFKDGSGNEYPEWEDVKLHNIANIKKGEQLKKKNIDNNGKYYHLNGGTSASSRTNLFNTNPFTISISEGGNSCGFIKMNKEYFFSGGHNYTLLDLSVSNFYLYAYLKNHEKKIMSLRVGSGLPNIQKKDISNYLIKIPRKEEQEKIGSFFKNLDEFIEKQANKVELLKQRKQSFLQKMFV